MQHIRGLRKMRNKVNIYYFIKNLSLNICLQMLLHNYLTMYIVTKEGVSMLKNICAFM